MDLLTSYVVNAVVLWNRCVVRAQQTSARGAKRRLCQKCTAYMGGGVFHAFADPCRADAAPERLTYFEIRVGNTPATTNPTANALCASYDTPTKAIYSFACTTAVTGRYLVVRLRPEYAAQRTSGSYLTLCEVQAFGSPARQARMLSTCPHRCCATAHMVCRRSPVQHGHHPGEPDNHTEHNSWW